MPRQPKINPVAVERLARAEVDARWPGVERRHAEVVSQLRTDRRVLACRHARPGFADGPLHVGAIHPSAGVMCTTCFEAHVHRHSRATEFTCDACGALGETMSAIVPALTAVALTVRTTRGRKLGLFGDIIVGGLGVCQDCARTGRAS